MAVQVRSTFKLTGWNANQLKLRVPVILTGYGKVMDQQLKEEIKLVQFPWPRKTYRKNGTIETSPRDIVDTGRFLRSQRRDRPSATELRFTWNTPYSALILTGYTTSRGTVVPGRNWIKPALDNQPMERFFAAEWVKLSASNL
jgi:hypothetical protein